MIALWLFCFVPVVLLLYFMYSEKPDPDADIIIPCDGCEKLRLQFSFFDFYDFYRLLKLTIGSFCFSNICD